MSSADDYGPAIDYILANRELHPRTGIDAELVRRGYAPAVIDEFWVGVQEGDAELQKERAAVRSRRILWGWNIAVWAPGIAGALYAGWSNCQGVVDAVRRQTCMDTSGQEVIGMTLVVLVFPIWLIGYVVVRLVLRLARRSP